MVPFSSRVEATARLVTPRQRSSRRRISMPGTKSGTDPWGRSECMSAKIVISLLMSAATLAGCGEEPVAPSGHLGDPSLAAALAPTDGLAGQLIAFASDRDGTGFQVFLMQANGPKQTQLTHVPGYNARPNWSHDGRRITFTPCRPTDFSGDIYVMNADGSAQTNLTHDFSP